MVKYICFIGLLGIPFFATAQEYEYNYVFFTNSAMSGNYFFSQASSSGASAH